MPEKRGSDAQAELPTRATSAAACSAGAGPVVDRARRDDARTGSWPTCADLPAVGAEVVGGAGGQAGDRAVVVDADGPRATAARRRRCPACGPAGAGAGAARRCRRARRRCRRGGRRRRPAARRPGRSATAAGARGRRAARRRWRPAPRSGAAGGRRRRRSVGGRRWLVLPPPGRSVAEPDQRRDGARAEQRQTPDAQRGGPSGRAAGQARSRQTSGDRLRRHGHGGLTRARLPGDAPHGCADGSCGACAAA